MSEQEQPPGDDPDALPAGGWFAYSPVGGEDLDDVEVAGEAIRLMWDYGVRVPLWDEEGLLPDDAGWLQRALGLSSALVADLAAWGESMERLIDHRGPVPGEAEALDDLDERARALVTRVENETGGAYVVRYRPWR